MNFALSRSHLIVYLGWYIQFDTRTVGSMLTLHVRGRWPLEPRSSIYEVPYVAAEGLQGSLYVLSKQKLFVRWNQMWIWAFIKYFFWIPLLELCQQNQEILFLIREVTPEDRFTNEFGFQISNLDNQTLAFLVVLELHLGYLTLIPMWNVSQRREVLMTLNS